MIRGIIFGVLLFSLSAGARDDFWCASLLDSPTGLPFPNLVVITHQIPPMHLPTVRRFSESAPLSRLPILLVNDFPQSDVFRSFSGLNPQMYPAFFGRAQVLRSSLGVIPSHIVNADTVYLAGGSCGICLTHTVESILAGGTTRRFVIFTRLTYGNFSQPPAADRFLSALLPENEFERAAEPPTYAGAKVFATAGAQPLGRILFEIVED